MRLVLRLVICLIAFMVGFAGTVDFGAVAQDGRNTASQAIDGVAGSVTGNSFNPKADQCVLYSYLMADFTSSRHVEAGLVRCDSQSFSTGACRGGYTFAERFNGSSYGCNVGNSFTNGARYNPLISRDSGTAVSGVISGTSISQTGFGGSDDNYGFAWGEATGASSLCPTGNHNGDFDNWNRVISGSGWGIVNNSSVYHQHQGIPSAPCWSVSSISGGDFNVN